MKRFSGATTLQTASSDSAQCFPCGPKPDVVMKPRVIAPVLCTCNEPQKGGFFMKFLLKIIGLLFPNLGIGLPVCLGH